MRSGFAGTLAGALLAVAPLLAVAEEWGRYDNPRFAYAIDIPPGFSDVAEAGNNDGGEARSADGKAELRIWGAYLVDRDFTSDIADRVQSDVEDGWTISYDRRTATKASWSGSKEGRVFYSRAMIGCDDAAIYFRLEYGRAQLKIYEPVLQRLVKSLHAAC